jgi:hypothetical protein
MMMIEVIIMIVAIMTIIISMATMMIMAVSPPWLNVRVSGSVCLTQPTSARPNRSASRSAWLQTLEQRRLMERALELAAARSAVYRQRGEARGNFVRLANGGYVWGSMDVTGPVEVTVIRA